MRQQQNMDHRELAKKLLARVVNENMSTYRQLFSETSSDDATDLYWRAALSFFNKLDSADKEIFFSILRQVSVDTVSNVTGAIDGSSDIGLEEDIHLTTHDGKVLSGFLQDHFLEAVEIEDNAA